jgi:endoglucanase
MDFMNTYNISWCNWSVADKEETSSILKPGANPEGGWPKDMLTESGLLIRDILISEP